MSGTLKNSLRTTDLGKNKLIHKKKFIQALSIYKILIVVIMN